MSNLISPAGFTSGVLISDTYTAPGGSSDSLSIMTKINGSTIDAALEIQSTTGGFQPPRMTTAQKNLINPDNGMQVFDLDLGQLQAFILGAWVDIGPAGGVAPADATYILQSDNAFLPNAQSLGALTTGLTKNTVTAGVGVLGTAIPGTDYYSPGNPTTLQESNIDSNLYVGNNITFTGGIRNTIVGSGAAAGGATLTNNTFYGAKTGSIQTAYSHCVLIGDSADTASNGTVGGIAIGSETTVIDNDSCVIGNGLQYIATQALGCTLGSLPVPFDGVYVGGADTNNVKIVAGTMSGSRTYVMTDIGSTFGNIVITSDSYTSGGIYYSTSVEAAISAAPSSQGLVFQSGATATPVWSAYALSLGGNLTTANSFTTSGNFAVTQIYTGATNVTFPTSGTLATTAGTVSSVSGTTNQINSTGGTTPVLSLSNTVVFPGTVTLNSDPTQPLQACTKQYADAIAAGIDFKDACYTASTVSLTANYLNGISGAGATLANSGTLAAFALDGVSPPLNSRVLIKNQSSTFQNGIYTVSIVGSGSVAWVLTRATDYDTPAKIFPGTLVPVTNGTVNGGTSWLETATVVNIGTDPITFSQFTFANPVISVSGTSNRITSTGGQTPAIDISASYVGQSSITTLGTIGTGTWAGTQIGVTHGGTGLTSTTVNQLLYSSATNTIAGLATATNGTLITDGSGVPSISSTLPTAVQNNITHVGTVTAGTWNGNLIDVSHGGLGLNGIGINAIPMGSGLTSYTTLAAPGLSQVLTSDILGVPTWSSTLTSASQLALSSVGTLTAGTWNANVIAGQYGGTGVANTGKTFTIGGNTAFSGAFTFTGTLTGNTSVTFPTSGTLVTTAAANSANFVAYSYFGGV